MDYLRTLGSAAVSSLVQKSGLNLPFTLGQKVTSFEGTSNVWTLYDATKRDDGSPISVFEFKGDYRNDLNLRALAKNALHKLRATRHPDVLKFVGEVETETTLHIMTERVRPLAGELQAWSSKSAQEKQDWLLWGLHRITTALAFVNDPCNSTHGSIRVGSIFVTPTGEWKLGGFEVLTSPKDVSGVLYTYANRQPEADAIAAPEVKKAGWSSLKENPVAAVDSYALALLIHTLFNPAAGSPPTTQPPHNPPQPSSRGAIPQSVFPSFKKLLNPNPKPRIAAKTFLELGMSESAADGGFFKSNRLLQICEGLEGFSLMSEGERAGLLRTLKDVAPTLPGPFATQLILPSLLAALSHPATTTSAPAILPLAIQLGKNVPSDDHLKVVIEPVIKLFASPDRVTRMALLDMLPDYAGALDKKTVTDKVWPHLQTGFTDTVPVIREATIKAIGLLSDKFSERILNNELLRHLARLQSDPEASIRTNTCILIGRLGPTFGYNTKRKVLVMAFAKALKDDSVHARVAGLMAFMACMGCFEVEELAGKVVGVVAGALVDKEKIVRDQAFKAVELFMKRLETHAATMPETVLDDDKSINLASFTSPTANGQTTLASSAAGAAGALAGWAISSIGKMTAGDMQSNISPPAATAPPPVPSATRPMVYTSSAPVTPSAAPVVHAKGLQLGAHKAPRGALPAELEREARAPGEGGPAWGDDDLMDVHADEDDWSAFESAPSAETVNAVGLGFADLGARDDNAADDPWGSLDAPEIAETRPTPSYPSLSMHTRRPVAPTPLRASSSTLSASAASSRRSTPVTSPKPPDQPAPVRAALSPEEKAAEMARRKEERKQRIAQLKEQKRQAGAGKA